VALAASFVRFALHDLGAVEVAGLGDHPLHGALLPDDQLVRPASAGERCSIVNAPCGIAPDWPASPDVWLTTHTRPFRRRGHPRTTAPAVAASDSTMNGCGLMPGWWTTRPNTCPVARFRRGQTPCEVMTCGGVPLLT
jgi:hypothetical protein